MPYVDNTFYTNTYKGTLVPSSLFNTYSMRASYRIQLMTLGKSDDYKTSNNVKYATCSLLDFYYKEDNGIYDKTSESVDGYSISYDSTNKGKTKEEREHDLVFTYLGSTGIMTSSLEDINGYYE